ncbi:MAG: hypothetical protein AAF492_24855, partial [Verrucomicrobiota bacterium]
MVCALGAMPIGLFIPWAQQAADAATRPYSNQTFHRPDKTGIPFGRPVQLPEQTRIFPAEESVEVAMDDLVINILPLLTFQSQSPDRFWTIFAPTPWWSAFPRHMNGLIRDDLSLTSFYRDIGDARLRVDVSDGIRIEASTYIPEEVYSHLNTFCEIHLSGVGDLALSFSPCPKVVPLKESGYPTGEPIQLAYLDADNRFHVARARSGEKGPYKTLTQGRLKEEDTLGIVIHVKGKPVARMQLHDWARQASRRLSPTAGWGLPENAIEFSLRRDDDSGEGLVFVTLAGTSVGRGWDSVGHRAGMYRNTITIEPIR